MLHHKALINTWLQHFEHLVIMTIVADVFENITVCQYTHRSEENPDWDISFDVRYTRSDSTSALKTVQKEMLESESSVDTHTFLLSLVEEFDLE